MASASTRRTGCANDRKFAGAESILQPTNRDWNGTQSRRFGELPVAAAGSRAGIGRPGRLRLAKADRLVDPHRPALQVVKVVGPVLHSITDGVGCICRADVLLEHGDGRSGYRFDD